MSEVQDWLTRQSRIKPFSIAFTMVQERSTFAREATFSFVRRYGIGRLRLRFLTSWLSSMTITLSAVQEETSLELEPHIYISSSSYFCWAYVLQSVSCSNLASVCAASSNPFVFSASSSAFNHELTRALLRLFVTICNLLLLRPSSRAHSFLALLSPHLS